jgi:hypothetical protein
MPQKECFLHSQFESLHASTIQPLCPFLSMFVQKYYGNPLFMTMNVPISCQGLKEAVLSLTQKFKIINLLERWRMNYFIPEFIKNLLHLHGFKNQAYDFFKTVSSF